jgi:hypothetical protein
MPRARRLLCTFTAFAVLAAVLVVGTAPAFASVPDAPGAPTAIGMQGAAALRWSPPGDVGSPPLTRYRIEADDGSGWSPVAAMPGAREIASGNGHSCALLEDDTLKCWGGNGGGQLGLGDTANRGDGAGEMGANLPTVDLGSGRHAVAIAAGHSDTCALLDNGTVKCWGFNAEGQLGLGDTANRGDGAGEMGDSLPAVSLGTGRTAVAISVGGSPISADGSFACALLDNGSVKCWGENSFGALGVG